MNLFRISKAEEVGDLFFKSFLIVSGLFRAEPLSLKIEAAPGPFITLAPY
jgi:hypothetical protein